MFDIAPPDYERWAVVVSPLQVPEYRDVTATSALRHTELLAQVSASLSHLDSRKKEGLAEQDVQSATLTRNTLKRSSEHPSTKSYSAKWGLLQPLPVGIYNTALNQSTLEPQKISKLYKSPETTRGLAVRISG